MVCRTGEGTLERMRGMRARVEDPWSRDIGRVARWERLRPLRFWRGAACVLGLE